MKYYSDKNDIIVEGVNCLDLELTLDCGQAFRWVKQEDNSFSGAVKGVFLNIKKDGDKLIFKNTSKKDFENIWINYFDLEKDYDKICERLKQDKLINSTVDEYYGIRILNQDSWESLCSFVISQQNNIKRIKGIIKRLCNTYGDEITNGFYSFPDPERLAKLDTEDFEKLGMGYRAKYVARLAKDVAGGKIDFDKIKSLPIEEARVELLKIYGVGAKVADCALLFGFGFYDAFPIDVWIKRVMKYYPDGLPKCFDRIRGIAQQYLFYWARKQQRAVK
ncbi:MAG: DNA-3-methyladenine glycosylase 2 family protein [Clostridiales bacterium]|nr:DNA-3-methyladenine glycosylase 2 family protein [Clostridiales bacterium]